MKNPKVSIVVVYANVENTINNFIVSLENQTFQDFEVVFVNCNSDEKSIETLSKIIVGKDKMIMLSLPYNNDYEFAKNSGADIVSGDYICFVDATESLGIDFLSNLYYSSLKEEKSRLKTKNNKLYKRNFVENNAEINNIISVKITEELEKISQLFATNEQYIKEQFENCYKNTDNSMNNKVYSLRARCDAVEKLVYEKENIFDDKQKVFFETVKNEIKESNNNFLNTDIPKIYDYINLKSQENLQETSKIKDEIKNVYSYIEKVVEDTKLNIQNDISSLYEKIDSLNKEQKLKYNNIKTIIENLKEEMNAKIEAISLSANVDDINKINKIANLITFERVMNDNFDKIYSYINDNNTKFYKELTELYKEVDEKIKK